VTVDSKACDSVSTLPNTIKCGIIAPRAGVGAKVLVVEGGRGLVEAVATFSLLLELQAPVVCPPKQAALQRPTPFGGVEVVEAFLEIFLAGSWICSGRWCFLAVHSLCLGMDAAGPTWPEWDVEVRAQI